MPIIQTAASLGEEDAAHRAFVERLAFRQHRDREIRRLLAWDAERRGLTTTSPQFKREEVGHG